jgi:hypothetical protein
MVLERQSKIHSRRKWADFPLDPRILDFMSETVIVADYSFQNLVNNVKSVWTRHQSTSIARLLNTKIGSNPVTGAKNWFNNLESISLMCDYACAFKVSKIYEQIDSNPLFERPPKAPTKREIPTIISMAKDIHKYGQNGILGSTDPDEFYQANIPFVEIIELLQRFMLFCIQEMGKPEYIQKMVPQLALTFYYEQCVLKFS